MPHLDLPEFRLFFTDDASTGHGDGLLGRPTLLVHGWLGSSDSWIHQLPALRRRSRTIAPDLRGHGRSGAPDSAYTPEEFADDLARLLDHLAVRRVVLFGHSFGASVGTLLAVSRPELVAALVLIDPDYAGDPAAVPDRAGWLAELETEHGVGLAQAALARLEGPHTPPHLREWHRREVYSVPAVVRARTLRAHFCAPDGLRFRPGSDAWLLRRRQPVLAFHRDPDRASVEERLARHPASRVIRIPDSGHWPHQEWPERFLRIVESWLAGLPADT